MSKQKSGREDPRFKQIDSFDDYLGVDLARTHGFTRSEEAAGLDPDMVEHQHNTLLRDGYVIIENLVPPETLDALRQESQDFTTRKQHQRSREYIRSANAPPEVSSLSLAELKRPPRLAHVSFDQPS